jgi:hypothetical protein
LEESSEGTLLTLTLSLEGASFAGVRVRELPVKIENLLA